METYEVRAVTAPEELQAALGIRDEVFVREQHVSPTLEHDEYDAAAQHFLAFADGRAVATARLLLAAGEARIGRMAVLKEYRRQGVGWALLKAVMARAEELGATRLVLHAQAHARNFYLRAGFVERGEAFVEAGILHIEMVRELEE